MSDFEVFDFVKKPLEKVLTPIAESVGKTLGAAWYVHFGWIEVNAEMARFLNQVDIENYKQEIINKGKEIPPENLVEPQMNIVGPALEASKYCLNQDELRNMFSSLIASSIDSNKVDLVQPAFVEIIKQLSVLDAKNITFLSRGFIDESRTFPIAQYKKVKEQEEGVSSSKVILENVLINQIKENNTINLDSVKNCSISLVNLERLGLIQIRYGEYISDFNYGVFEDVDYLKNLQRENESHNITYEMQAGYVRLTAWGSAFVDVCL